MKKQISDTELSAYLDGESKNPLEVERQIQESHDVARRYAALSRMSQRLRALPEPEIRSGFTGRVLASIEEPSVEPRMRWGLPATMSVAAAAVVLLVATVVGLNDNAEPSAPLQTAVSSPEDEAAILEELERRIAESPESQILLAGNYYAEPEPVEELPEGLLTALAPAEWADTFSEPVFSGSYEMELSSLSDPERAIFAQLLEEHARADAQGQAAHEG